MWFTHSTDALVLGHIQHKIRKPDRSFTSWISRAAEIEPAVGWRHQMRKRQNQDCQWLFSSFPSCQKLSKFFFLRVHEKEVQSPHGFNSWCSLLAAAQVFMQCCRKRVNEQHLARYRKLFSKTRKITNPPFFLVFRTMSLLHWGHFRMETGIAG